MDISLWNGAVIVKGPGEGIQLHECWAKSPWNEKEEALGKYMAGEGKNLATVWTVCHHVQNMIKVVTLDFSFKVKSVYAHLSTNIVTQENGIFIEMSWKIYLQVGMRTGVPCFVFQAL